MERYRTYKLFSNILISTFLLDFKGTVILYSCIFIFIKSFLLPLSYGDKAVFI